MIVLLNCCPFEMTTVGISFVEALQEQHFLKTWKLIQASNTVTFGPETGFELK